MPVTEVLSLACVLMHLFTSRAQMPALAATPTRPALPTVEGGRLCQIVRMHGASFGNRTLAVTARFGCGGQRAEWP